MGTINGIGTRFLGYSPIDQNRCCYVTEWITFFYLPVVPLTRMKIERALTKPNEFKYRIIEKSKLQFIQIIKTYFFGWLLFPVLLFTPLILCVRSIADKIGIPKAKFLGLANPDSSFGVYEFMIIFGIIWFIVFTVILKNWDEKRGLPKKYYG